MTTPDTPRESAGLRLALDLGPLLVFFLAYLASGKSIFIATGIFMAATVVAMVVSLVRTGRVTPLMLISGVMVVVFGGLTLLLHDKRFTMMKPTIYYLVAASLLFYGLFTGRPMLKAIFGQAYPGLSQQGWLLLSRNWALFFLCLAAANELVWRTQTESFWVSYKFVSIGFSVIFAIANMPMLKRHGLEVGTAHLEDEVPPQG